MVGLYDRIASIHPIWAIDEYAIILRSWVWFSPPQPPTAIDISDIIERRFMLMRGEIIYKIDKGASFCHVNKINPDIRGIPWVTSGTQKWNGDSPNFIVRANVIIIDAVVLFNFIIDQWPEYNRLVIAAIIRSMDAVAWVRKYFVAASVDRGLCCFVNSGIIASMFISNPTQVINQWELVITIRVPEIIVVNTSDRVIGLISTGRI